MTMLNPAMLKVNKSRALYINTLRTWTVHPWGRFPIDKINCDMINKMHRYLRTVNILDVHPLPNGSTCGSERDEHTK
jgi:hypothetical protein